MFLSIVAQSCTIVLYQYQKVSQIFKVEYYIVKIGHFLSPEKSPRKSDGITNKYQNELKNMNHLNIYISSGKK